MINYSLACDNGHEFDGWFRNSGDYDKQKSLGLVVCPVCDSASVQKRLMAPNVSTSRSQKKARGEQQAVQAVAAAAAQATASKSAASTPSTGTAAPAAGAEQAVSTSLPAPELQKIPEKAKELIEALREFRKQVVTNSEYVGDKFAEEARKIHYGETEERGIYGETTPDDAKELLEEGIELMPLPVLPEDRN